MSDLDRAVGARIDAYRPDHLPPFESLKARRARRNRTRGAGAAALAVAAVAVAVAVVAFGASSVGSNTDQLPVYAGPADDQQRTYVLAYERAHPYDAARDEPAANACVSLPGISNVSVEQSLPPTYVVTVNGDAETAFAACVSELRGVALSRLPQGPRAAAAPTAFVSDPVLHDPSTAPVAFTQREPLPSCGSYSVGVEDEPPAGGFACLADSADSPAGAELAVQRLTTEGDPVVLYWRVLPGSDEIEFWADSTREGLGSEAWGRGQCEDLDRQTGPTVCEVTED